MVFFSRMRLCDCDVGAIVPNFYFRDRSILQDSLSLSLSLSLSRGVLSRWRVATAVGSMVIGSGSRTTGQDTQQQQQQQQQQPQQREIR